MKFMIYTILLFFCVPIELYSQQSAFPLEKKQINLYSSYCNKEVILKMNTDTMDNYVITFYLKKRKHKRFHTDIDYGIAGEDNFIVLRNKWVAVGSVGIYGRMTEGTNYVLYNKPNRKSKKSIFPAQEIDSTFQILDMRDGWYKVMIVYRNKRFSLWLPPESVCDDFYNSCT